MHPPLLDIPSVELTAVSGLQSGSAPLCKRLLYSGPMAVRVEAEGEESVLVLCFGDGLAYPLYLETDFQRFGEGLFLTPDWLGLVEEDEEGAGGIEGGEKGQPPSTMIAIRVGGEKLWAEKLAAAVWPHCTFKDRRKTKTAKRVEGGAARLAHVIGCMSKSFGRQVAEVARRINQRTAPCETPRHMPRTVAATRAVQNVTNETLKAKDKAMEGINYAGGMVGRRASRVSEGRRQRARQRARASQQLRLPSRRDKALRSVKSPLAAFGTGLLSVGEALLSAQAEGVPNAHPALTRADKWHIGPREGGAGHGHRQRGCGRQRGYPPLRR